MIFNKKNAVTFCSSFLIITLCLAAGSVDGMAARKKKSKKNEKNTTLAVMNFDCTSDRELGAAVSEIVRSEISSFNDIPYIIVERIMLDKIMKEQSLSLTGAVDESSARGIGKLLYADNLVVGSLVTIEGTTRISASIVETASGVVIKQVLVDVPEKNKIASSSAVLAWKLFDKKPPKRKKIITPSSSEQTRTYATIYTDARGIHTGGKIVISMDDSTVSGYTIEDIGRADMNGSIADGFINGFYKAQYGYGNFSFRIIDDGKYLAGTYYQTSNGANGDWIASEGASFKMPPELYTGKWKKGSRVLARWPADGYFYPAKVAGVTAGMYDVSYDDGDKSKLLEMHILEENLEPGDTVFGNWKSQGKYFRGTITERKGDSIFIKYDDGDTEWTVIGKVRVMGQ